MRTNPAHEARPEVSRESGREASRPRAAAAAGEVELFRQLFERNTRHEAHPAEAARVAGRLLEERERAPGELLAPETAALLNTHRLVLDLPAAPTAMPLQSAGLGPLIEKHLRQLLVSESTRGDGREARVMLRLSDATLPGTDLMLTRGESGWELRAEVASAAARDALHECAPDLIARFAAGGLGKLSIETVLRGV
ncbi:MAG TPA: hypothetical protein VIZ64_08285 [Dokdonella sp.]